MEGVARAGFAVDRRPWLTRPHATGGEREYGRRIAGTWDDEITGSLSSKP